MATVIDNLSIMLNLDTSGVKKGEAQTKKSIDAVKKNAKETGQEFKNASTQLLKFFAVAFGASGFVALAQNIIQVNTALGNMARRSTQSASSYKAFRQYVESLGESGEAAALTIERLGKVSENIKFGIPDDLITFYSRLNIEMYDVNGKAKDGLTMMRDISAEFEKRGTTNAEQSTILGSYGFDQGSIQAILGGSKALQQVIDKSDENKKSIEAQTKAALEFTKQINLLKQELDALANSALEKVLPMVTESFKWLAQNKDSVESAIVGIAGAIMISLVPAMTRLSLAGAKFTVIAVALNALFDDWKTYKAGGKSLIPFGGDGDKGNDPPRTGVNGFLDDMFGRPKGARTKRAPDTPDDIKARKWLAEQEAKKKPKLTGLEQATMDGLENKYDLPQGMLDSLWAQESGRGKNMLSSAGAKGHFQFMPATAKEYGIAGKENDFNASSEAAAKKLSGLVKKYGGNYEKALQAYNWGEGNVASGKPMPAETASYGKSVMNRMALAGHPAYSASASMPSMKGGSGGNGNMSTSEVNIGVMNINTQATNATAIAGSIQASLKSNSLVTQANGGVY